MRAVRNLQNVLLANRLNMSSTVQVNILSSYIHGFSINCPLYTSIVFTCKYIHFEIRMVLSRCPLLRNIIRYSIMENQGTEIETDSSILQTYIAIKINIIHDQ